MSVPLRLTIYLVIAGTSSDLDACPHQTTPTRLVPTRQLDFSWNMSQYIFKQKLCETHASIQCDSGKSNRYIAIYPWPIFVTRPGRPWSYPMMTSSNGKIFRVTGPLCGEFTGPGEFPTQRPVTRSFDVFFDVRLIKRLSKHSRGWWFETLSHPLWRPRNAILHPAVYVIVITYPRPIPILV